MLATTELPFITKILIPKVRDFVVSRERLLDPMMFRVKKKVQVVYAPAGYGKTSLLSEFASRVNLPLCWYSFSTEDRDPVSFLRYCIQSVRARFPGFGATSPDLFKGGPSNDRLSLVGLFTTTLHNDLDGHLIFAFDDVHWTDAKVELEETLSLLIDRAPPNIHFLLGSRTWPALGCLPRLTAGNELDSFDTGDLRFTTEETAELLSRLSERHVTTSEAEAVKDRTGGWAAAIVLIAKNHSTSGGLDPVKLTDEGVLFDYFSREVFERFPDPLRSFLLNTSILRQFTTTICDKLFGFSESGNLLDQVKARSLFLEERTGEGAAYAYHDLFREYLEHKFQTDYPVEYKSLNLRAAALYSGLGDDDSAIYHFLRGGEPDRAAEIIKEFSCFYYDQARWDELAVWLSQIPQGALEKDPDLHLLSGQILLRLGNPTGSLEQLENLASGPFGDDPVVLGKALSAKSTALRRLGHLDMAVDAAREGLTVLQGSTAPQEQLAEAYKQLGDALSMRGDYDDAKVRLQAALDLANKGRLRQYSLICNDLGVVCLETSDLDHAVMYFEQARVGLATLGNQGQLAESLTNLALVYFHKGEFDLALDEIGEALLAAHSVNYPRILATALMHQGMVQRALGAYSDSLSSSSRALELARQILDQRLIAGCTESIGSIYRQLGETSKAEALLNHALLEAEESGQRYIVAVFRLSLGKVYCQLGSYSQALLHLGLAEQQLSEIKSFRRMGETKLYQAAIYYRTNRLREAMESLTQVADLVSQFGYGGFLLADGDAVLDVVRFGAARRAGGDTFTRLVGRLTQTPLDLEESNETQSKLKPLAKFPVISAYGLRHPTVTLDTHEVTEAEWQSRKAKELFFFLHFNRRALTNEQIMDNLWPDISVELSSGALRVNIFRLRQALFYDCILSGDAGYSLNPEIAIETDVERFLLSLDIAADSDSSEEERILQLEQAISLYQSPFLNGVYSDWCQVTRADLEIKYHTALMKLAAFQAGRRDFRKAIGSLEIVIAEDPYNEEAHYQRIVNYIEAGEIFAAMQQLRKYATICKEEIQMDLPKRFILCHKRITTLLPLPT